ncbi:DUF305 domain-containing protein [bacterium]|nr:DUF305 domain-containing protein [bacterium]
MAKVCVRNVLHLMLAALVVVAFASAPAYAKSKSKKVQTTPTKQQAKFEKDFLKKMMDRHQRGINLATWVDSNTTMTELNAFAQQFKAREQDEMTSMSQMLKAWYNITYTPKNHRVSGDDIEDMEDAETPEEFALEALGALKGYDKNEIAQMKQPKKKAFHAELKAFAADLTSISKAEVSFIQDWIKQLDTDDEDDD